MGTVLNEVVEVFHQEGEEEEGDHLEEVEGVPPSEWYWMEEEEDGLPILQRDLVDQKQEEEVELMFGPKKSGVQYLYSHCKKKIYISFQV